MRSAVLAVFVCLLVAPSAFAQGHWIVPAPAEARAEWAALPIDDLVALGLEARRESRHREAVHIFEAAMMRGSVPARGYLGAQYYRGRGVWHDRKHGLKLMQEAARSGDVELMHLIGRTARGSDQQEALIWLERAADAGFIPSMIRLSEAGTERITDHRRLPGGALFAPMSAFFDDAEMNSEGRPMPLRDAEEVRARARTRLAAAADAGDAMAMSVLGRIFMLGIGVDVDLDEAEAWLKPAAAVGHALGQRRLALLYLQMPDRSGDALRILTQLAEDGDRFGMLHLSDMYLKGTQVPQDYDEAAYWKTREKELGKAFFVNLSDPEFVKALQRLMTREGTYVGAIDGEPSDAFSRAFDSYAPDPRP